MRGHPRRPLLSVKRFVDLGLCAVALPVLLPLVAITGLAIRLDSPGPILYSQFRTGRNGARFRMYKFRTMVRDAEARKASLMHLNIVEPPAFKILNDPRITRVGRFLRRASIDEIPQLINVARGEMTLVGPRPTTYDASSYDSWHTARLEVPPGITGLWQVAGRNDTLRLDERVRLDLRYIARMSLWTDIVILARTVGAVIRRSGA
jgi:lipopolysaccharide/colanic/teichoic acid biosynthesis glycosyltransferase